MTGVANASYGIVLLILVAWLAGFGAEALPYDYTATTECLSVPHKPQYNGGIIRDPELNHGLKEWSKFGSPDIKHRSVDGNSFIVVEGRNRSHDSVWQKIYLEKDKLYTFSAWVQVNEGEHLVRATFNTSSGLRHAGITTARSKCWSMMKGGITVDTSEDTHLYLEATNASVQLWIDSVSLQPFTREEWESHQVQSVEKARKTRVRIAVLDSQKRPVRNASITIQAKATGFPLGCAMSKNILTNTAYQNWFKSRFRLTVFENEMKWYSNEAAQGREDYSVADAMMKFARQNSISVRGHNVLWDDPNMQPRWVKSLPAAALWKAVWNRVNSVMGRYKGQVIGWDVMNENLHFSFFEGKLGQDASGSAYQFATAADGRTTLFLNEYNTIEEPGDSMSSPAKYIQKIRAIQAYKGIHKNLGIGLEGHFRVANIPYTRSAIDTLGSLGLPIWITELDVQGGPNQVRYLEQILTEVHSHPRVNGIVLWAGWRPEGCYRMCLTDNNFRNLPTGDVVDRLHRQWGWMPLNGMTDSEGFFEASLFHGTCSVKVMDASDELMQSLSDDQVFEVGPTESEESGPVEIVTTVSS
ncbi:hypothetical protein SAY87_018753 [Trapa incisa]|uniref:GH10 domain-containing protein n=1 Tax=Trapa incisa TaxID=236973 RepID=A0AAN7K1D5_9MYRT|nr:hypothetical protein SAY87_018753 [Trapa incisa]